MRVKTRVFLVFMSYVFGITIVFLYILNKHAFTDINMVLCWLSLYFFGLVIAYDYSKRETFFTFGIVFNIFGALYTNFYIIESILLDNIITSETFMAMRLSYISILSFDIAYYIFPIKHGISIYINKREWYDQDKYNPGRIMKMLLGLFAVSLAAEYYVIFSKIGLGAFFSASRSTKTLLLSGYSLLSFYQHTIPLIAAIALYLYLNNKTKHSFPLFLGAIIVAVFNAYIRGSRAELICIILPIIFLLHYYNKISNRTVIVLGLLSLLLFGLWKSFYSTQRTISYDSEFNTWYKICNNVLKSGFKYKYGSTYMTTIKNLIIPVTDSNTLSTWYLQNYEADVLARGGGRGFSAVLEAYINFNAIGNVIIYFLYGEILRAFEPQKEEWSMNRINYKLVLAFIILSSMYLFFRAESYSLWKNMAWFKIYPTALIFICSRKKSDAEVVLKIEF